MVNIPRPVLTITAAALFNSHTRVVIEEGMVQHLSQSIMPANAEAAVTTAQQVITKAVYNLSARAADRRLEHRDSEPKTESENKLMPQHGEAKCLSWDCPQPSRGMRC